VFSIDWLRRAVPVEREICVLATKHEAIAAAKNRAPDVVKRHSGREPNGFRLSDSTGKILAIVPVRDEAITITPSHHCTVSESPTIAPLFSRNVCPRCAMLTANNRAC